MSGPQLRRRLEKLEAEAYRPCTECARIMAGAVLTLVKPEQYAGTELPERCPVCRREPSVPRDFMNWIYGESGPEPPAWLKLPPEERRELARIMSTPDRERPT